MKKLLEWIDKYEPNTLSEVVGNKKAIHDLTIWFNSIINKKDIKRILLLTGAPGTGKNTIIKILIK